MADLRITTRLHAIVDERGDARVERRWTFQNICNRTLDLTAFRMNFESTTKNIFVETVVDSTGNLVAWHTEDIERNEIRVNCDFDKHLSPREIFYVQAEYRHPGYLVLMPSARVWVLNEWFTRKGPLKGVDFAQEQPQRFEFSLQLADPRRRLLVLRNPLTSWRVDCRPEVAVKDIGGTAVLQYTFNLGETEQSDTFYVMRLVETRGLLTSATSALLSAGLAIGLQRLAEVVVDKFR